MIERKGTGNNACWWENQSFSSFSSNLVKLSYKATPKRHHTNGPRASLRCLLLRFERAAQETRVPSASRSEISFFFFPSDTGTSQSHRDAFHGGSSLHQHLLVSRGSLLWHRQLTTSAGSTETPAVFDGLDESESDSPSRKDDKKVRLSIRLEVD